MAGAPASDLTSLTLCETAELLRTKAASPVELTRACLDRIQRLNPALNAFITLTADTALDQARLAEQEIVRGQWRGPLHGVPIALKDLIATAGVRTTAASRVFAERIPPEDAEVVRRLKAAGAVLLGKLNLHEFAYGGSGLISAFGPARNPWSTARITGGSSSGPAAAVAARLCYAALGTDTAGSIRLPAACCGLVGLKPTYGLVSARGVVPLAWSYDHVGPMTRTVADAAALLTVLAGYDPQDFTSRPFPPTDYASELAQPAPPPRLGVARDFFFSDLDPEAEACVHDALGVLERLFAGLRDITLPVDTDRTAMVAEAWAFHEPLVAEHAALYHPETLRRIRAGEQVSSAEYVRKRTQLDQMRRAAPELFRDVDLAVTPTIPAPPATFAQLESAPAELRPHELLMLRNTRPFNVLGLPTISLPCGFTRSGLPVGLQIAGRPGDEITVLRAARAYERETEWHTRAPAL